MRALSEVLEALESEQDVEIPMDPKYYERLHSRIMMAVESRAEGLTQKAPPPWFEKPAGLALASAWRPGPSVPAGIRKN